MTATDELLSKAPFTVAFTVETWDLRNALRSVMVHAHPKPDLATFHRVRLDVGPENLEVSATNMTTGALALVSVIAHDEAQLEPIDLSPTAAREILSLFGGGGKTAEDEPEQLLQLEASQTHVRITDMSGLFPGKSYTLPRTPVDEGLPSMRDLFSRMLCREPAPAGSLAANGDAVASFKAAAVAYRQPLLLTAGGRREAVLVECGESFLGALMPLGLDEERQAELMEWRRGWERRLSILMSGGGPG